MATSRTHNALVALAAVVAVGVVAIWCLAPSAALSTPAAVTARTLNIADTAYLRCNFAKTEGSIVFEEGKAYGQLPGTMVARLNIEGGFSGSFVLTPKTGGIIRGHGSAKPSLPPRQYESFRGSLTVTGGSGRYAHAHGQAGLYGVYDRNTCKVTVQTTGRLSY
jgi:hypothetical protein